ncbi:hypothetical protein [Salinadaptatus halalkaliphilus]|uniref:hypothetical protein n=1 Tax=Salinadaptatus halalkaliphilus TaxID=2419781 RepID=UPI001143ED29|nr:hypothetical protein [Salinadaptatus halalkaliphilus]
MSGIEIVVSAVQGTAFWTTVLLPVLVPLLVVVGIVTMTPSAAVGFLGAYCACAVLGHNHSPT